jgi:uncharacterized CHY-type Zn-finger protein
MTDISYSIRIENEDVTEVIEQVQRLRALSFLGRGNTCPRCHKTGSFGTITEYTSKLDNKYIICGWCSQVSQIIEVKNDD